MSHFDHDYAEFDEYGICRIRCQCCGTPIAERTYIDVPSKLDGTKFIQAAVLGRNSSWREVWVRLSNGSNAIMKVCKACEHESIDTVRGEKVMAQFKRAWDKEAGHNSAPPNEAKAHRALYEKVVVVGRTPDDEKPEKEKVNKGG